jgi:hypothetical protein
MPYSAGPNIAARPNLVFEYDTGDVKNSYIGEPTTNLYPYSEQVNQWSNNSCTVTANATVAPDGTTTADFLKADGTANYHTVYQIISTTSGLTYTFSCYVQPAGGFNGNTNTFFMQTNDGSWKNITFNLTNLTYSTNAGSGFVQQLQGGWYRVGWTVTIATGGSLYWYIYPTSSPSAETLGGGYYVWGAQLEQKDHATQYLQTPSNTSATRSNTQGLLDVSGYNRTMSLANVSFNSSAQITFDGTDDYIYAILFPSAPSVMSAEFVFYKTTSSNTDLSYQGFVPRFALRSNQINLYHNVAGQTGDVNFACTINTNTYYHVVLTFDAVNKYQCYLNTVSLSRSYNGDAANGVPGFTETYIGYQAGSEGYFAGSIPICRYYDYALSAQEVRRNYNQLKGRFNLP